MITTDASTGEDFTAYCQLKKLSDGSLRVERILYEIPNKPYDAVAEALKYPAMW